jgi:hypothetical protein
MKINAARRNPPLIDAPQRFIDLAAQISGI